jgi:hypothetical protein
LPFFNGLALYNKKQKNMDTLIMEDNLLFEKTVRLTKICEYGFSWGKFTAAKTPLPPEGTRFDIHLSWPMNGSMDLHTKRR